jgi:hypothetical protein
MGRGEAKRRRLAIQLQAKREKKVCYPENQCLFTFFTRTPRQGAIF